MNLDDFILDKQGYSSLRWKLESILQLENIVEIDLLGLA